MRQFRLYDVASPLLIVENPFALIFDDLDDASSRMAQMKLYLLGNDGSGGKHSPIVVLLVALPQLSLCTEEFNESGLQGISYEEVSFESGLYYESIVENFTFHDELAF